MDKSISTIIITLCYRVYLPGMSPFLSMDSNVTFKFPQYDSFIESATYGILLKYLRVAKQTVEYSERVHEFSEDFQRANKNPYRALSIL